MRFLSQCRVFTMQNVKIRFFFFFLFVCFFASIRTVNVEFFTISVCGCVMSPSLGELVLLLLFFVL